MAAGVLLKIGLPLLMAGGGAAAYFTAPSDAAPPPATIWIDSPDAGVLISAGTAFVVAHATAGSGVDSLSLEVDGAIVATSTEPERFGALVSATLSWDATDGPHELVVIGGDYRSEPVVVQVGVVPEPLATQPTLAPTVPATSSTTIPETTTTLPETTTTIASTVPPTAPPPTAPPTAPPPTAPPAPSISNVVLVPNGGLLLCNGDQIRVTANVTNATSGQMRIYFTQTNGLFESVPGTITGGVFMATRDGASPTKVPTVPNGYYVTIIVSGPGGSYETNAGTFIAQCTKD